MLAWEEAQNGRRTASGSPGDSDHEGRGDHMDGLIGKLISACQMNNITKAFDFHEKLRQMRVPLFEGVYKLIIECCMRTQQLGHAMQFYETLKGSGQRISPRLVIVLMEACAKEQYGDKVYTIWNDWCPAEEPIGRGHSEVLLVAISAMIRTMSPELAIDVLRDAMRRSGDSLAACLADAEIELEELLQLCEAVSEEARDNGMLMEELASRFVELHELLQGLRWQCLRESGASASGRAAEAPGVDGLAASHLCSGDLLMEDVDLDLELAAM